MPWLMVHGFADGANVYNAYFLTRVTVNLIGLGLWLAERRRAGTPTETTRATEPVA